MANPITWRNVNDPSGASNTNAQSGALNSARGAFEGMAQSFTNAVQRQQGIRADNRQNMVNNNTQDFKNLLSQARTPEELEAMKADGVFQQALDQNGRMINQDVANMGAVDNRLTGLRETETADHNYQQTQTARADAPLMDQFRAKAAGFTADNGIDGIEADYNRFSSSVEAAVASGDLSQGAAAELLTEARQNRNTLESTFDAGQAREVRTEAQARTDAQNARDDNQRVLGDSINNLVNDTATGFDPDGDTITAARMRLMENMPEDATPQQRNDAARILEESILRDSTMAEGDQRVINGYLAEIDTEYDLGNNVYALSEGENPLDAAKQLQEDFTLETEDGEKEIFGIANGNKRGQMIEDMTKLVTTGVDVDGVNMRVPSSVMSIALEGLKTRRGFLRWDSVGDLENAVRDVMSQDWHMDQLKNYEEGSNAKSQVREGAFREFTRGARSQPQEDQPAPEAPDVSTRALEQAGQGLGANNVGGDVSANVASLYDPLRQQNSNPTPPQPVPQPVQTPQEAIGQPTQEEPTQWPSREEGEGPLSPRMREEMGGWISDKFTNMRESNKAAQVDRVRAAASDGSDMSLVQFTALLRSSPNAINELSAEDRNKLRRKYGASLINQYID